MTTTTTTGAGAASTPGVSVATRDVHLSFGTNHVLRGVTLDVPAASTTCVIGPSGSGKSTLLRIVNRLLEPDSGDVLLEDRSVLADDPDQLRQRVGMVFQHFNLFPHKTVRDNITLGLTRLRGSVEGRGRRAGAGPARPGRACGTRPTCAPARSRVASSSGSPSPAPWPCSRR